MPVLGYGVGGSGSSSATAASVGAIADRSDITDLAGGAATDLDVIATTGITVPYTVMIFRNSAVEFWTLQSGTDAENEAGGIVRPDDYATTTNEKVWKASLWFG